MLAEYRARNRLIAGMVFLMKRLAKLILTMSSLDTVMSDTLKTAIRERV